MKTYKVKTEFTFTGEFFVKAEDKDEAKQIVEQECGMVFGNVSTSAEEETLDWEFDMIPEKKIKTITVKKHPKKQK